MNSEVIDKQLIIERICYTELVYGRINKKLGLSYSKGQIKRLVLNLLSESPIQDYTKVGKNYYISNFEYKIRITINSHTFRVITVDNIV